MELELRERQWHFMPKPCPVPKLLSTVHSILSFASKLQNAQASAMTGSSSEKIISSGCFRAPCQAGKV